MAASPSPTVRRKRLGIELRRLREQAQRDSKDRNGGTLIFSRATWAAFLDTVRRQAARP